MIQIGSRRELFWDDYLIDTEKTTAETRLGTFTRRGAVAVFDKPWEKQGAGYFTVFYDEAYKGGIYRLYYKALSTEYSDTETRIAYMESPDGINWERPSLGLCEFQGSRDNNLIIMRNMPGMPPVLDNFQVFVDDNPNRVVKERYKAVLQYVPGSGMFDMENPLYLMSYVSDDGLVWRPHEIVTYQGRFDSLNTCHWNREHGKYFCFIRNFHYPEHKPLEADPKQINFKKIIRDIRIVESEDFIHWTEPELLTYGGAEDIQLYTNGITPYYRAPHILTGFPTRYTERREWTRNYDRLCGAEMRKKKCAIEPRLGLAITDCLFMCSRDGHTWLRPDEAILRPDPEREINWIYGDCYPAVGMIETPGEYEGEDSEISMYTGAGQWRETPCFLMRRTIRKDGFMLRHAGGRQEKIVTKVFSYEGERMLLNFATSGRGYIHITLRDTETGAEIHSDEIFGNRTDRQIDFDGEVKAFSLRPVIMEIEMRDADVYSFKFE